MGSGSSSQSPKQNTGTSKQADTLPGSSVPPKGLPYHQNTGKSVKENERRRSTEGPKSTASDSKRKVSIANGVKSANGVKNANGVKREKSYVRGKRSVLSLLSILFLFIFCNDTKSINSTLSMLIIIKLI